MKAPFIIFDGGDGTGKATQAKMTFDQLELVGYKGQVKHIDFPQYKENFMGRILFDCKEGKYGDFSQVLPQAASLIYAGDRFESKEKIEKWLMEKNIVISDRYVSANQIHQGGKIGDPEKRRRFIKWLEDLEYGFLRLPRPDIVIYLDAEVSTALKNIAKRGNADNLEKNRVYLENSRESALAIAEEDESWVKIKCDKDGHMLLPEIINKMIMKTLAERKIIPHLVAAADSLA